MRLLIFSLFLICATARAEPRCAVTALRPWLNPTLDAAVELELGMSPEVMALVTTPDGTVGPLLRGGAAPSWLQGLQRSGRFATADEVPFDRLTVPQKLELIRASVRGRKESFYQNRAIAGLVTRDKVRLRFDKPTLFLGREYPPGGHTIDIGKVLERKVEFRSPQEIEDVGGVELHFRGGQTAGAMSNDAWTLLEGARIPRSHQHVHFVAPLPMAKLRRNPEIQAIIMGDYYRRANLAAEMVSIVHYGKRIARVMSEDGDFLFGGLQGTGLSNVANYFQSVGEGRLPKLGSDAKIAWIGMRGADSYDKPGLWGMEFRAIAASADPALTKQLLEGLQATMNREEYGLAAAQARQWYEMNHTPTRVGSTLAKTHYNRSWDTLMGSLPGHLREAFPWLLARKEGVQQGWRALVKRYKGREEVRMLFFDWSNDPLFFNDVRLQEGIRRRQIQAIRRLERGESENEVMKDFLLQSGLYTKVLESVGLRANLMR